MLQVSVIGQPELEARLNRVLKSIGSLEEEFALVGAELTEFYSTGPFLTQGGIYGEKWQPLTTAYKKRKQKKWPGRGILVASGKMMDSFKFEPTPTSVTIRNDSQLFGYHQLGTEKMPQRVMMLLDDTRRLMVVETVRKSLRRKIDVAWSV